MEQRMFWASRIRLLVGKDITSVTPCRCKDLNARFKEY